MDWTEANLTAESVRRLKLLEMAEGERELQALLYARCREDILFWFDNFVWCIDPRESATAAKMPMILFPRQRELILWIQEREAAREGGLVEKSRDFGATVLFSNYAIHALLFRPGFRAGFGSRKMEYVDNSEDDKTIFAKLRFCLDNLPWWMKPAPERLLSKYCLIKNQDNDSSIAGEGGQSIGRGDRTTFYYVDESAFLEQPQKTDAALSQTTNCRFDGSTPNGIGNSFYKRRHSGKIPVFRCHWMQDERKNHYEVQDYIGNVLRTGRGQALNIPSGYRVVYPWYEKQKAELLDEVVVAQELDIDYAASIEGVCCPAKWVAAAVNLHTRMPELKVPDSGALRARADLAGGGANQNVLMFLRGQVVQEILPWRHESPSYTAGKIKEECEERETQTLYYDNGGGYGGAVGDMAKDETNPPKFQVRALNFGGSPSNREWPEKGDNGKRKTSKDKFTNARSEWWYCLRERFRKTWETVEGHAIYPPDELISIPNHAELIADLSKPLLGKSMNGKIALESKERMKERGVSSPDFADPLAMDQAAASADEALADLVGWFGKK
jgi:hypothetical protein